MIPGQKKCQILQQADECVCLNNMFTKDVALPGDIFKCTNVNRH